MVSGAQRDHAEAQAMESAIDVVVFNGKATALDRQTPTQRPLRFETDVSLTVRNDDEVMGSPARQLSAST